MCKGESVAMDGPGSGVVECGVSCVGRHVTSAVEDWLMLVLLVLLIVV